VATHVYYFSGTGNTLTVAKALASRLDGEAIPIASIVASERIELQADVIGIAFPVYYGDLPNIVRRFARELGPASDRYVFGVATYGGAAGVSLKTLGELLGKGGTTLSAAFGVHMPQNAFRKFWEDRRRIAQCADRRIESIARAVKSGALGTYHVRTPAQWAFSLLHRTLDRAVIRHMERASGTPSPSGLAMEELLPLTDKAFTTADSCIGCGTCVHLCPVGNIEIVDDRPVWQHRCENCLACVNWCPVNAIRDRITASGYRYRHPDVSAEDIARQRPTR
jgi:ferredoxin